jgi:ankyrin repeat protein
MDNNSTQSLVDAINSNNLELIRQNLVLNANISTSVPNEFSIVTLAVLNENIEILKLILKTGYDPNAFNIEDSEGTTSLYWATCQNSFDIVQILIEAGAKVDIEKPQEGITSIHVAAERGFIDILRLLLEKAGGKNIINSFDFAGNTPLIYAASNNQIEAVHLLIQSGADINAHDESRIGNTALRQAVRYGNYEIVKLLLDSDANPLIPG